MGMEDVRAWWRGDVVIGCLVAGTGGIRRQLCRAPGSYSVVGEQFLQLLFELGCGCCGVPGQKGPMNRAMASL